jgi:hypothetical protein
MLRVSTESGRTSRSVLRSLSTTRRERETRDPLQLSLYGRAVEEIWGHKPHCCWLLLRDGSEVSSSALADDITSAARRLATLAALQRSGSLRRKWDTARSQCGTSQNEARPGRLVAATGPSSTTAMQRSRARSSRGRAGSTRPGRPRSCGRLAHRGRRVARRRPLVAKEGEFVEELLPVGMS